MNKFITAIILVLSLISVPEAFAQARKKQPAKAPAKSAAKKKQPAKTPAKSTAKKKQPAKAPAKNQRNSRNDRNSRSARNSRNSRDDRNARGSRNSRNDRNSRASRNSRNSRNDRASRSSNSRERRSTAAPAPAPAPRVSTAAFNRELIVNSSVAPIRGRAAMEAPYVANARLGTTLFASERNSQWYRVQYSVNGKANTGWVEAARVSEVAGADRTAVYRQIVERNSGSDMDFTGAVAMYDFLTRVSAEMQPSDAAADLELKRIVALRSAVSGIDRQNRNVSPYADFMREHEADILFNDATGEFVVSSNLFWNLATKYRDYGAGDEIAWNAARNPLPGSCGQALSCYIFNLRMSDGEYLALYPNGRRADDAMKNLSMMLQPMIADLGEKRLFRITSDQESKDELNSLVAELKTIVNRSGAAEKATVLGQLGQISAAYR